VLASTGVDRNITQTAWGGWAFRNGEEDAIVSIVEMHNRLQAFEISIMTVCLHEVRRGPFVNIAQCRHT